MNFFFYGTLMDADVLEAVLGRRVALTHANDAVLRGYRRVYRLGATYPVIVADGDATVDGKLVRGLTAAEKRSLDRFEGADYRPVTLAVYTRHETEVPAFVYLPLSAEIASADTWHFTAWRRRHRSAFLHRARRTGVPC